MKLRLMLSILIIFLLFIPSLSAATWNSYNHDFQNTSSTSENGPAPPLKYVWNPKNLKIDGDWLTPIVHGNVIYLVRSPGTVESHYPFSVMAVDMQDGKVLWRINDTSISGATDTFYEAGTIYIDTRNMIEAINATEGKVVWKIREYRFSNNMVYWNNRIYGEIFENDDAYIVAIDPETGKIVKTQNVNIGNFYKSKIYNGFVVMKNDIIYTYNRRSSMVYIIATNLKNATVLWRYKLWNYWQIFTDASIIVGKEYLYVPFTEYGNSGIKALNKTSGKLAWSKVLDPAALYNMYRYKFAYSEKYHILVRLNSSGYLIAVDSRNGQAWWSTNAYTENEAVVLKGTPVIANNYIYVYSIMLNKSNYDYVGVLQIFKIDTGELAYAIEFPYQVTYIDDASGVGRVPDIAVSHRVVIVPDGYLYVLKSNQPPPMNLVLGGAGFSAVLVSIIATVIVVRKKQAQLAI